jgi:hypothetical protein
VFRMSSDGTLDFVRKYDIPAGGGSLMWVGFLSLDAEALRR